MSCHRMHNDYQITQKRHHSLFSAQGDYDLLSSSISVWVDTKTGHRDRGRDSDGCYSLKGVLQGRPRFWVSLMLVPQASCRLVLYFGMFGSCDCGRVLGGEHHYFYACSSRVLYDFGDNKQEHCAGDSQDEAWANHLGAKIASERSNKFHLKLV